MTADAVAYLETDEYFYSKLRTKTHTMVVRRMFDVLYDSPCTEYEVDHCDCLGFTPDMPLASTEWNDDAEEDWLKNGNVPKMDKQAYDKHYENYRDNHWRNTLVKDDA